MAFSLPAVLGSIPLAPSTGIDLSFFKWVIIIGVIAIAILYIVKRVAEYLTNRKTEELIRNVKDGDDNDRGDKD